MEIYGKDFWRHVGKSILMPHPTNPNVMPIKLKIASVHHKKVLLRDEETGNERADNYSKDKNKYKVVE